MTLDVKAHWQRVYQTKAPHTVSWYQPTPARSLEFIAAAGVSHDAAILDVGGGASTLVDHLQHAGFTDVTVLDVAPAALAAARTRLGAAAAGVEWIEADITSWPPPRRYDVWHDRAVFHFLIDSADQRRYLDVLRTALAPDGYVILATFSPDGPTQCSGLPVQRHDVTTLGQLLGERFELLRSANEQHVTPGGGVQQFVYGMWRSILTH